MVLYFASAVTQRQGSRPHLVILLVLPWDDGSCLKHQVHMCIPTQEVGEACTKVLLMGPSLLPLWP